MTATIIRIPSDKPMQLTFVQALFKWDSILFALLCVTDMLSTLYWVHDGVASESNPMLALCLQHGPIVFVAAKLVSFVPMLLFAAWYRLTRPQFIALALRAGVAAYVLIYIVGVGIQFVL
jgi:hypothetical protein